MRSSRYLMAVVFGVLFAGVGTVLGDPPPLPPRPAPVAPDKGAGQPHLPDTAMQRILQSEYRFSNRTDGAVSAPNRSHGLRAVIGRDGLRLTSRTKGADPLAGGFSIALAPAAWGRGGTLVPIPAGEAMASDERAEVRRGPVREWYVNDERGLEQGFDLAMPPDTYGEEPSLPLCLRLALDTSLQAYPDESGRSIVFRSADGTVVVQYAGLAAEDALGRSLEARLAVVPGTIDILVDDRGAVYPVRIDPLIASGWSYETNQAGAQIGLSAATAGDVNGDGYSDVIVGAHLFDNGSPDEGRAFLFLSNGTAPATTPAWTAEGDQDYAQFGIYVAAAGDVNGDGYDDVLVAAWGWDDVVCCPFDSAPDAGRVWVWHGSPAGLSATPAWTVSSYQTGANMGYSAGTAGDVNGDGYDDVVVGTRSWDNGPWANAGRAQVFLGSAGGLATTPVWTIDNTQSGAELGVSVAGAGDVNADGYDDVVVGAYLNDSAYADEGGAWLYLGGAAGPSLTPSWARFGGQSGAQFGISVAPAGDTNGDGYADVIVGAWGYDNGHVDEGAAFLFTGSMAGLSAAPVWTVEADQTSALLGYAVGTAGDLNGDGFADVVVGAHQFDATSVVDRGRVQVFPGSASGPPAAAPITLLGSQAGELFGVAASTAGDVNGDGYGDLIVGALGYDGGQADEGRVQVFLGSAAVPSTTASQTIESNQANRYFGTIVGTAGDVNGDGFSDVIESSRSYSGAFPAQGRVDLFLGSPAGMQTTPSWSREGTYQYQYLSAPLDEVGDINGDGYSDIVLNSTNCSYNCSKVFAGGLGGLSAAPIAELSDPQPGVGFSGFYVAGAGDVNGDGYGDLIGTDINYQVGGATRGWAGIYLGGSAGPAATPAWSVIGDQADSGFGFSPGAAGDVNGDGYDDVIVSAPDYDNGETNEGRVFVYLGSPAGPAPTAAWTAESNQNAPVSGTRYGERATRAGDVNRDGYADVLVGAKYYTNGETSEGRAYLYLGSAAGLPASPSWIAESNDANARFGSSLDLAGDVNGDGYSDVIIGGEQFNAARIYLGSASGLGAAYAWSVAGASPLGAMVASAGDVNGDGFGDVVLGDTWYSNGQAQEGRILLYLGNGGDGLAVAPRMTRTASAEPIAMHGRSDAPDAFGANLLGRSAAGRDRLRLEWEAKPLGQPFDGSGHVLTPFTDSGVPGPDGSVVAFAETIAALAPARFYHWRARVVTDSRLFPRSPWRTMPYNGWNETDVSTAGCWDTDGDGYGSPPDSSCAAGAIADCNDASAAIRPGAVEICDGVDNNCSGAADEGAEPAGRPEMTLADDFFVGTTLSWTTLPDASAYDVVVGAIGVLRSGGGDFTAATLACLADDTGTASLTVAGTPPSGDGFWFLVRPVNACGNGTYDSGGSGQAGSRDAELAAAVAACP